MAHGYEPFKTIDFTPFFLQCESPWFPQAKGGIAIQTSDKAIVPAWLGDKPAEDVAIMVRTIKDAMIKNTGNRDVVLAEIREQFEIPDAYVMQVTHLCLLMFYDTFACLAFQPISPSCRL